VCCCLRSLVLFTCLAALSLGLAGCGGDDADVGGSAEPLGPVVEERPPGAWTPGSKEEGKLPAHYRR